MKLKYNHICDREDIRSILCYDMYDIALMDILDLVSNSVLIKVEVVEESVCDTINMFSFNIPMSVSGESDYEVHKNGRVVSTRSW